MKRVLAAGAGTLLLSATMIATTSIAAHASTLTVGPGGYKTISSAIAAAHSGDTILVHPGTYRENLNINGKNVAIRSTNGAPSTIIAGAPGRSPVTFQHVGRSAQLWGFRVVSGSAPAGQGGGITVANGASPTIAYNEISSNRATDGGGILVYNASAPDIAFNSIGGNAVSTFGGGIFAYMGSSPVIRNNKIFNNSAMGGGGVYLEANSGNRAARAGGSVTLNTITGNSAREAGGGIMLRTGEVASITHNTISGNRAPYGGGIHIETNGSGPYVAANKITSNSAPTSSAYGGSGSGGGIAVFAQSTPTITGNSIVSNASSIYGGGIVMAEGSNSRVSANNIQSNKTNSNGIGGGIFVGNASGTVWNNVIQRNTSGRGGGVGLQGTGNQVILNNSFVSNQVPSGGPLGGGLFVGKQGVAVKNNLFLHNANYQVFDASSANGYANNLADKSVQGDMYTYHTGGNTTFLKLNSSGSFNSTSNIDGDSAVVNGPAGNYMLTARSVAVNRARASGAPPTDYRNAKRPYGGAFDIGAYEYTG